MLKKQGELFRQFIDNKGISDTEAGRIIGVSSEQISKYYESNKFQRPTLIKIKNGFPDFLVNNSESIEKGDAITQTGENNSYNPDIVNENESSNTFVAVAPPDILPTISKDKGVPYYDVDFFGGYDLVYQDKTVQPAFFIDFLPFNDCDAWINVSGKSMGPLIAHGDIVALKYQRDWKRFILEGEIYAFVTDNGFRTIKQLGAGPDKDHFMLIPYNKDEAYQPQPIPKEVITHIFRVKGNIKKFF